MIYNNRSPLSGFLARQPHPDIITRTRVLRRGSPEPGRDGAHTLSVCPIQGLEARVHPA